LGLYERNKLLDLTSVDPRAFRDMHTLYDAATSRGLEMSALAAEAVPKAPARPYDEGLLTIPFTPTEIWAAGVTYLRSREARESETKPKGLSDHVYTAPRPELFVKDSGGLRCRGPGQEVCIRGDTSWSVPEPELAVVVDENAKILGYTAGNDVSAR